MADVTQRDYLYACNPNDSNYGGGGAHVGQLRHDQFAPQHHQAAIELVPYGFGGSPLQQFLGHSIGAVLGIGKGEYLESGRYRYLISELRFLNKRLESLRAKADLN